MYLKWLTKLCPEDSFCFSNSSPSNGKLSLGIGTGSNTHAAGTTDILSSSTKFTSTQDMSGLNAAVERTCRQHLLQNAPSGIRECACAWCKFTIIIIIINKMASLSTATRRPYRCKKWSPRQTRFYRKRKSNRKGQSTTSNGNVEETNHSEDEESSNNHVPNPDTPPTPRLYSGSFCTQRSSSLAISSYMSRHCLTKQAQEDVLELLNLHVSPAVPNASLPTSLYSFRKNSIVCDPGNVEQLCHYFCPRYYFALPSKCNICPNAACGQHLCEELISCFSTLSVGDQLRNVFRREFNQCMLSGLIHVMIVLCSASHIPID